MEKKQDKNSEMNLPITTSNSFVVYKLKSYSSGNGADGAK